MTDRSSYPSEQADKFMLRLPDGMRERLKVAAKENNRSMNSEILSRLDIPQPDASPADPAGYTLTQERYARSLSAMVEPSALPSCGTALLQQAFRNLNFMEMMKFASFVHAYAEAYDVRQPESVGDVATKVLSWIEEMR